MIKSPAHIKILQAHPMGMMRSFSDFFICRIFSPVNFFALHHKRRSLKFSNPIFVAKQLTG
jgi:hypothetical protein